MARGQPSLPSASPSMAVASFSCSFMRSSRSTSSSWGRSEIQLPLCDRSESDLPLHTPKSLPSCLSWSVMATIFVPTWPAWRPTSPATLTSWSFCFHVLSAGITDVSSQLVYVVLGIEPRACACSVYSTMDLYRPWVTHLR